MRMQPLPEGCPRCAGSRLVRILWGYDGLDNEVDEAVGQGHALLGLNRRYFGASAKRNPPPAILADRSRLPVWGCLNCNPRWIDLHHLTLKQWEAEAAKCSAFISGDYERSADLHWRQGEIEREQATELIILLRELAGDALTSCA